MSCEASMMTSVQAMKAAGASKSMKVMKMKAVRAMPKSGIAAQVAENTGLKKSAVTQVLSSLADIGATEVKKAGSRWLVQGRGDRGNL